MQIIEERWKKIQELPLKYGGHKRDSEFCVMEAVAFVAGEPWSDSPECACPVISGFLRQWNDRLPTDADRDRLLKHFIPRVVGTRNPKLEERRILMIADWAIRIVFPELLTMAKRPNDAKEFATMPEI